MYDGECAFCRRWVVRWQKKTGAAVEYLPYQSEAVFLWFPELPRDQVPGGVLLIETDGRVYRGAEATVRSWAHRPGGGWALRLYQLPGCGPLAELIYRQVARNRHRLP